ncbi:MAG TPA: glycosyltransferase family 4 protein [Pyrinomonadaceae bacterium]|nr:glycosyltransferase family 4 protein [Pyrinomonadaceae bacterium]
MSKSHFQSNSVELKIPAILPETTQNAAAAKPRILMVGMHLTKTRGGITTLISEILKLPLKNHFEFIYVESQAEDFGRFRKAFLALTAIFSFLWKCLFARPKLVYVHLGSNASLYREAVFIFLAKLLRKRVIGHFHAGDVENYYPFQSKIGQKLIRSGLNLCDGLIAVSNESARQLREITPNAKISIIPNAIDVTDFDFKTEKKSENFVRLLFVGAIGKLKGERDLIKALTILRDKNLNLKVSFLGYGAESLKSYCDELKITDFIEFLGAVSLKERLGFFEKADIFVLPTYAEAMPMSVIEAMAAGLPVISTNVGGIPELVEDGENGFLFECGDVSVLAEKILLLAEDKNLRQKFGKKAREKARKEFDFNQYTEKLRDFLSEKI